MFAASDVILAVASSPGRSPRGVLRLSGAATFDLLQERLRVDWPGSGMRRGVMMGRLQLEHAAIPTIVLIMPGPHSYTGEDSAELQLPGNLVLLERIVDSLLDSAKRRSIPARRANPGEFTARAFLNGRMSLTQAEGVAATIAAQSDAELRAAHLLTSGSLGDFAHSLADDLATALALVEAGIDFTDQEDVVAISPADLHARLLNLQRRLEEQLRRSVGMEQLEAIPWVVLVGHPNAGKSALFNALLGHERAVVSPITGTTRDILTEPLTIQTDHGPAEVMLVDLAGLDEDASAMNQMMQAAARQATDRAELILRCVPVDQGRLQIASDEVLVRTKADLFESAKPIQSATHKPGQNAAPARVPEDGIFVSALTGSGLNQLKDLIARRLSDRAVSLAADATALRPRHESALQSALANIGQSLELVAPIRHERHLGYPELIASTMRAALDDLAALAGDISPDEVLGRVFATFCVGK